MEHLPHWSDYADDDERREPFEARPTRFVTILLTLALSAVIALGLVLVAVKAVWGKERIDNAVVFLADISMSMGPDEVEIIRASHATAIQSREVLDAIRQGAAGRSVFAYVEFADRAEVIVGWTVIDGPASAAAFAQRITESRGGLGANTAIGVALAEAEKLLHDLPYEADFRTVDVTGDGQSNQGVSTTVPRGMILAMGATINGLPMVFKSSEGGLSDWYADYVIGGPRAFLLELNSIADMPMMMRRKLILELF